MHFIMTNDVETTSLELNRPHDSMAIKIRKTGLPQVLDLCSKHDVQSTFFFTSYILEIEPSLIDIVKENDHEIACHGYKHTLKYAFDTLPLKKQIELLRKSKDAIENISNIKIESFRAPELRVNEHTVKALEKLGFKYDSSICPQRFDGPLSRGFSQKKNWLFAPRHPYYVSKTSLFKEGKSKVLEIPISAMLLPFIGTTMRVSPAVTRFLRKYIFFDAKRKDNPVVFIFHPTECIPLDKKLLRRKDMQKKSLFTDVIRKKLKHRNLGKKAVKLMDEVLKEAKKADAEFISISKYGKRRARN